MVYYRVIIIWIYIMACRKKILCSHKNYDAHGHRGHAHVLHTVIERMTHRVKQHMTDMVIQCMTHKVIERMMDKVIEPVTHAVTHPMTHTVIHPMKHTVIHPMKHTVIEYLADLFIVVWRIRSFSYDAYGHSTYDPYDHSDEKNRNWWRPLGLTPLKRLRLCENSQYITPLFVNLQDMVVCSSWYFHLYIHRSHRDCLHFSTCLHVIYRYYIRGTVHSKS